MRRRNTNDEMVAAWKVLSDHPLVELPVPELPVPELPAPPVEHMWPPPAVPVPLPVPDQPPVSDVFTYLEVICQNQVIRDRLLQPDIGMPADLVKELYMFGQMLSLHSLWGDTIIVITPCGMGDLVIFVARVVEWCSGWHTGDGGGKSLTSFG